MASLSDLLRASIYKSRTLNSNFTNKDIKEELDLHFEETAESNLINNVFGPTHKRRKQYKNEKLWKTAEELLALTDNDLSLCKNVIRGIYTANTMEKK